MSACATPVTAFIGLGANLGDAQAQVRSALERLATLPDSALEAASSLFRTAPVDADGDDFINAVARLRTTLSPDALLENLQQIEQAFGRERSFRNAPRTLDLDLLLYGDQRIASATLEIPHPRMTQRAFVLLPLLQVDPFVVIPGAGPAHQFAPEVAGQRIARLGPPLRASA